jgi:hypothetical protein
MNQGEARYYDPNLRKNVTIKYDPYSEIAKQKAASKLEDKANTAYYQFKQKLGREPKGNEIFTGIPESLRDNRDGDQVFIDSQWQPKVKPAGDNLERMKQSFLAQTDDDEFYDESLTDAERYAGAIQRMQDREVENYEQEKAHEAERSLHQGRLDRLNEILDTQRFAEDFDKELYTAVTQAIQQIETPGHCGIERNRLLRRVDAAMENLQSNRKVTLQEQQKALMDQIVENERQYQALDPDAEPPAEQTTTPSDNPQQYYVINGERYPVPGTGPDAEASNEDSGTQE